MSLVIEDPARKRLAVHVVGGLRWGLRGIRLWDYPQGIVGLRNQQDDWPKGKIRSDGLKRAVSEDIDRNVDQWRLGYGSSLPTLVMRPDDLNARVGRFAQGDSPYRPTLE